MDDLYCLADIGDKDEDEDDNEDDNEDKDEDNSVRLWKRASAFVDAWSDGDDETEQARELVDELRDHIKTLAKGDPQRKRRYDETIALNEIREEMSNTDPIIKPAAFKRLVQEIGQDFSTDIRFSPEAIEALQEAAEDHVIRLFEKSNLVAIHSGRTYVAPKDFQLVRKITRV
jgi:histone H3